MYMYTIVIKYVVLCISTCTCTCSYKVNINQWQARIYSGVGITAKANYHKGVWGYSAPQNINLGSLRLLLGPVPDDIFFKNVPELYIFITFKNHNGLTAAL